MGKRDGVFGGGVGGRGWGGGVEGGVVGCGWGGGWGGGGIICTHTHICAKPHFQVNCQRCPEAVPVVMSTGIFFCGVESAACGSDKSK